MLRHSDVWHALDALAQRHGLSPSGLARKAGLDPTTFNRSKRVTAEGKRRWPSTESIAKALSAVGASPAEFIGLIGDGSVDTLAPRLPVVLASRAAATEDPSFDETGRPAPMTSREMLFPRLEDPHAFALEMDGDGLAPLYPRGTLLIVSPAASLGEGDRVVVRTRQRGLWVGLLLRQTPEGIELRAFDQAADRHRLAQEDVIWMSRIVWASQ
ncbi:unnamed protein product [Symbiodinium necroappetens]|uniref:Peptidase S24/S26A/S26B/S26C domain-containing protein n=1 Tax=Symbiodinium necroappetens TaxID=1628268 RepID=A0A812KX41_9DINO|nr:unnamed protein product [Symbiodinium necroappetens]